MGFDLVSLTMEDITEEQREANCTAVNEKYSKEFLESQSHEDPQAILNYVQDVYTANCYPNSNWFRWGIGWWENILELAHENGWEPNHAQGYYSCNDGNVVDAEEAGKIAAALKKHLDKEERSEAFEKIKSFISFCRKGGFVIY